MQIGTTLYVVYHNDTDNILPYILFLYELCAVQLGLNMIGTARLNLNPENHQIIIPPLITLQLSLGIEPSDTLQASTKLRHFCQSG